MTFDELLGGAEVSAVHLEMRDVYTPDDPVYQAWRGGEPVTPDEDWRDWFDLVRATTARGVSVRRARVVSEPLSAYVSYEYDLTGELNVAAGEHVRWLPRHRAGRIMLPANDFWLIDRRLVRFGYFDGDGNVTGDEITTDPKLARQCADAFEAVWARAVPHEEYKPS